MPHSDSGNFAYSHTTFCEERNYRWDLATDGSTHREPMILSLNYWEQTANALKIVEPTIYSSPGNVFQFSAIPEVTSLITLTLLCGILSTELTITHLLGL